MNFAPVGLALFASFELLMFLTTGAPGAAMLAMFAALVSIQLARSD